MNKSAPQASLYSSETDTVANILVDGYFNDRKANLYIGDILYVFASDKSALIKVTDNLPDVKTTLLDEEGAGLEQLQIYYYGDAGLDTNNGTNDETPFLTADAAIAAVLAETPGIDNRFVIKGIGGIEHDGDIIIPTYTVFDARGAHIKGEVTLSEGSKIIVKQITADDSSNGINVVSSVNSYYDVDLIDGGDASVGINYTAGSIYGNARKISMTGTGSKAVNAATGGELFLTAETVIEDTASTVVAPAIIHENTNDFKPLLIATLNASLDDKTGNGADYVILFDTEIIDAKDNYTPGTGIFLSTKSTYYLVCASVSLGDFSGATTSGDIRIVGTSQQVSLVTWAGSAELQHSGSGAQIMYIPAGTDLTVHAQVFGEASNRIDIEEKSTLSVYQLPI